MNNTECSQPIRFAIVGPPSDLAHLHKVITYYRDGKPKHFGSSKTLLSLLEWMPPYAGAKWPSLTSTAGVEVSGVHIWCPIMPEMAQTMKSQEEFKAHIKRRVLEACCMAADHGAQVVALGAFCSIAVVGMEEEISREAGVAVTSGNTLTAWLTVAGVEEAARRLELDLGTARVAMLGASGDIGRGVCRDLVGRVAHMTLTARNIPRLQRFADSLVSDCATPIEVTADNAAAVGDADIVIGAAISPTPLIHAEDLMPGAIVCDVGYPKNITAEAERRDDVLAFCGGLAAPPFEVDFGYDVNLPTTHELYGCLSEAIVLALEGRAENFSTGRGGITRTSMQEIGNAALYHGFDLAPFYAGYRRVTNEDIQRVRGHVRRGHSAEEPQAACSSGWGQR